jgi:hypothetical protein
LEFKAKLCTAILFCWSSKRSFVRPFCFGGVQSEALFMVLEFKAKLCSAILFCWSSKRSFAHGAGVQSEALLMALEFKAKLCTAKQSFALNSNAMPNKASL